ncbi:MAG: hypothetical protein ABIW38_10665 [Ferruginibacter sp.]
MRQLELLHTIIDKDTEAASLKHSLTNLTEDFPWFGIPHYFLLQQMDKNDPGFPKLAAKTAMHFSNPYLLKYRLNNFYPVVENKVTGLTAEKTGIINSSEFHNYDSGNQDMQPAWELTQVMIEEKDDTEELAVPLETAATFEAEIIEPAVPVGTSEIIDEEPLATQIKGEPASQKDEMIFEPLYASDYFASQGIKLSEQETSTDKLGKQVKSFTDWLKTMKKLPGSQATQVMHVDNNVEQLAEKSNTEAEVITESMAEVFLQQGRKARAEEIYHKLSLLNPSKSAYFAAKIEHLRSGDN